MASQETTGLQVVRVKRRRDAVVPDQLILHQVTAVDEAKRRRTQATAAAASGLASKLTQSLNFMGVDEAGEGEVDGVPDAPTTAALESSMMAQEEQEVMTGAVGTKVVRRQRYIRVTTLQKADLKGLTPEQLSQLLGTWREAASSAQQARQQQPQQQAAEGDGQAATTVAQAGPRLQYTAMRGKRPLASVLGGGEGAGTAGGLLGGDEAGMAVDAGAGVGAGAWTVLDVLAHGRVPAGGVDGAKRQKGVGAGAEQLQDGAATAAAARAQQAAYDVEYQRALDRAGAPGEMEDLLKAHFLPMLDSYLSEAGYEAGHEPGMNSPDPTPAPSHPQTHEIHHYKLPTRRTHHAPQPPINHQQPTQPPPVTASAAGAPVGLEAAVGGPAPGGVLPSGPEATPVDPQGEGAQGSEEESEDLVYDMYLPVEDEEGGQEEGLDLTDACMMGARDHGADVPIIEVPDDSDDEELWALVHGVPGVQPRFSLEDEEDSNAESFYANTYPDDEGNDDLSDDEDMLDDLEDGGRRRRHRHGGYGGYNDEDEEFDVDEYDSDDEVMEGMDVVNRSRKAAQAFLQAALAKRDGAKKTREGKGAL